MVSIWFLFLWLASLSMIMSRSIYVAANGTFSLFFVAEWWSNEILKGFYGSFQLLPLQKQFSGLKGHHSPLEGDAGPHPQTWWSRGLVEQSRLHSIEPTSLKSPGDAAADPGARLREPVSCPRGWGLETHISHALLIKTESPGPDWNLQPDVLYCASDTGCVPLGNTWGIRWFARGSWKLQGKHHTSSRSTSFLCW